jgi:hypothetical protein
MRGHPSSSAPVARALSTVVLMTTFAWGGGLALSPSAAAQSISGVLLEAYSDRPVSGGILRLLSDQGDTVTSALTDPRGRFTLRAPQPGVYLIASSAGFHESRLDGPVELLEGDALEVELRLSPESVQLESIVVEGQRRIVRLNQVGFYDRARGSGGRFFTHEDIERRNPLRVADMLRPLPGVSVQGDQVVFNRSRGMRAFMGQGPCPANIWVDGLPLPQGMGSIDEIDPMRVAGIEVYSGAAQIPVQYGGANSACGVVLIWLR